MCASKSCRALARGRQQIEEMFSKDKYREDGLDAICKSCKAKRYEDRKALLKRGTAPIYISRQVLLEALQSLYISVRDKTDVDASMGTAYIILKDCGLIHD